MGIVRDLYYARKIGAGLKLPAPSVALLVKRLALAKILTPAVLKTVTGTLLHVTDALEEPAVELLVSLDPIQSGSGTPSPDNIRPITGRTGVELYVSPTQDDDDGTTYSIDWTSEAGTVYGGTLDVVTGVLRVDRVIDTVTKDSNWYSFSVGTGNASAAVQLTEYQNVKYVDGSSGRNGAISSTGKEAQNYWINARQNEVPNDGDMCCAYSSTGQLRFHRTDIANITDLATFKANFPDTQVVYPLAEPIEYTLTAQEVDMLLGENYLWTNESNDLSLTYYADGRANTEDALNLLLGNRYVNNHTPEDVSDREALDILLGR